MLKQEKPPTKEQIDIAIVSNDFYKTNEIIELFAEDESIALNGIFRAYHADDMFDSPDKHPDIVVSNGKTKDKAAPHHEESVTVIYPSKSKAKDAGVTYVRERRNPKSTKRAINRAIKKRSK